MTVTISDRAKLDLAKILSYILLLNRKSAESLDARFRDKISSLIIFPERGRVRTELGPNIRVLLVGVYLIIYRIEPDEIVILRVIDGRMDIEAEFRE
jgi:toxin ParE1/3/4